MSMCCSCGRFLRKGMVFAGRIDGFQPKKSKKTYLKVHFQYGPNVDKDPADDEETDDDGGDEPAEPTEEPDVDDDPSDGGGGDVDTDPNDE